MNPVEILSKIRQAGGTVRSDGDSLTIDAPRETLSQEDRVVLADNKETLVRLLAPIDAEREAIRWVEGLSDQEAETVVEGAIDGWTELVGRRPSLDEIEKAIEQSFASVGIEVSAKFDRVPAQVETPQPGLVAAPIPAPNDTGASAAPVCRCGSTRWCDVPIHNGQSTRRDCGECRRFIGFPIWYGIPALQTEQ